MTRDDISVVHYGIPGCARFGLICTNLCTPDLLVSVGSVKTCLVQNCQNSPKRAHPASAELFMSFAVVTLERDTLCTDFSLSNSIVFVEVMSTGFIDTNGGIYFCGASCLFDNVAIFLHSF